MREELRKIGPAAVREAVEKTLFGNNESARVSAIRLLSDLEVYRSDDGCERCHERTLTVEQAHDEFARLICGAGGRPNDALLAELERVAWAIAADTLGRLHTHTLEQARGTLEQLVRYGVLQQFIEREVAGEDGNGDPGAGSPLGPGEVEERVCVRVQHVRLYGERDLEVATGTWRSPRARGATAGGR